MSPWKRIPRRTLLASVVLALSAGGMATASSWVGGSVTIPEVGAGSPYPAELVANEPGRYVRDVDLKISRFTDDFPDDVDVLLRSPSGQTALVLSDASVFRVTLKR
jgi:hypothetical protein